MPDNMSTRPYSLQQYSLFPTCSPLPSPSTVSSVQGIAQTNLKRYSSSSLHDEKASDTSVEQVELEEAKDLKTTSKRFSADFTILGVIKKLKRQSSNMSQLIPLKLEALVVTSRTPSQTTTTTLPVSCVSLASPSPISIPKRPVIPSRSSSIRKARPGPVTNLTIFACTRDEWKKVMEEVKALYLGQQYHHCSVRCKQILKGAKDPYRVHPLNSIYLSFFAASSLEIVAASQRNESSTKLPLFQEALAFYEQAESYIEFASFSADPSVFSSSPRHSYINTSPRNSLTNHQLSHQSSKSSISSTTNSVCSSVDSLFSHRSSSVYSVASSLASPIDYENKSLHRRSSSLSSRSSFENCHASDAQKRPKKKVSFSSTLPIMLSENEIDISTPNIDINSFSLIDSFPNPPSQAGSRSTTPSPPNSSPRPFTPNPALARYRDHLADFAVQITYHINSLHASIAKLSSARAARRSNGPEFALNLCSNFRSRSRSTSSSGGSGFSWDEEADEQRKMALRLRIKNLKEGGWKRRSFDPERYRTLCEKALDECNEAEMF